jgi:3',5'-cyclic AMP phosphodiesterase CpdA
MISFPDEVPQTSTFRARLTAGLLAVALLLVVAGVGLWRAEFQSGTTAAEAGDATGPAKLAEADIHRPTRLPDRIVLTFVGDPTTSAAVNWRTDVSVQRGVAEIAVAGDNRDFQDAARQIRAITEPFKSRINEAHFHSVVLDGLTPGTRYAYRVGDTRNWSEWFHFSTASADDEPFTFVYFGDAQTELKPLWSRVVREAFANAPKARFLLHAGDLVDDPNSDAQWGEWFQAGSWLNAMTPNVMTPGNHEYHKVGLFKTLQLTPHWRPQFTLPENGPPELAETVYTFDYQGVRFVSLNSNERQQEQVPWLEHVLSTNPARWTIITFHHPIYSASGLRTKSELERNTLLRELWQPVFDRHRVDLVLQGHDHTYARSGLVAGDAEPGAQQNVLEGVTARSPTSGTVYVVSVSGPKMYELPDSATVEFDRVAENTQLFQIISIDGGRLVYEARTATGQPYDGFVLEKQSNRPNRLIEQIPDTPARHRPRATTASNRAN